MTMKPTPWGYSVESLDPIISIENFAEHGLDASDVRAVAAVNSASAAIRAYCGWHVAPSLQCAANLTADGGNVVQLPALFVSSITSVTEDGAELVDGGGYEWLPNGSLRHCNFRAWMRKWGGIAVEYSAGFESDMVPVLAQVCAQLAANALGPAGIKREQAGAVSLEYNVDADGQGGSMALTDSMKALLAPYRIPMGAV